MKTRTNKPAILADAVMAGILTILVCLCWVALMRSVHDNYEYIQPGIQSSSDQTIVPTAEPDTKMPTAEPGSKVPIP